MSEVGRSLPSSPSSYQRMFYVSRHDRQSSHFQNETQIERSHKGRYCQMQILIFFSLFFSSSIFFWFLLLPFLYPYIIEKQNKTTSMETDSITMFDDTWNTFPYHWKSLNHKLTDAVILFLVKATHDIFYWSILINIKQNIKKNFCNTVYMEYSKSIKYTKIESKPDDVNI